MKLEKQRRLVPIFGVFIMVLVLASTFVVWKYPDYDYSGHVVTGMLMLGVLLGAVMMFLFKRKET